MISQSKSNEHDKTNEENNYIDENELQDLQFGPRNKEAKENNSKSCLFIIGNSMIK